MLEQDETRGEIADGPDAEQQYGVGRTADRLSRPVVMQRIRGADDLDRQTVVAEHQVGESLRR
jgi:hypothetical protein